MSVRNQECIQCMACTFPRPGAQILDTIPGFKSALTLDIEKKITRNIAERKEGQNRLVNIESS